MGNAEVKEKEVYHCEMQEENDSGKNSFFRKGVFNYERKIL